jgi:hypothetical protein
MFLMLFFIAVGIIIGWNWTQPSWASKGQQKVLETVRSFTGKGGSAA